MLSDSQKHLASLSAILTRSVVVVGFHEIRMGAGRILVCNVLLSVAYQRQQLRYYSLIIGDKS